MSQLYGLRLKVAANAVAAKLLAAIRTLGISAKREEISKLE